jgi:hypothetical protein
MIVSRFACKMTLLFSALGSLAGSGCAPPYQSLPQLVNLAEIIPARGFYVSGPDLRDMPSGTYAWGRVCRETFATYTPRGLRMELVDAGDQVVADSFAVISPPIRRSQRCGFYNFRTNWHVSVSQHVHFCLIQYFGNPAKHCLKRNNETPKVAIDS